MKQEEIDKILDLIKRTKGFKYCGVVTDICWYKRNRECVIDPKGFLKDPLREDTGKRKRIYDDEVPRPTQSLLIKLRTRGISHDANRDRRTTDYEVRQDNRNVQHYKYRTISPKGVWTELEQPERLEGAD